MPKRCTVATCKNYQYPYCEKSFFRFPKDPALREVWISRCNRPNVDLKEGRVCSDHFEVSDYEQRLRRKMLKYDAIPSLLVHISEDDGALVKKCNSKANEEDEEDDADICLFETDECFCGLNDKSNAKTSTEFCIIDGCPNRSLRPGRDAEFFRFPKITDRKKQWIRACNKKTKFNANKSCVCSNHFKPEDFRIPKFRSRRDAARGKKKKLKTTAIPSLNIPNSESSEEVFQNVVLLDPDSVPPAVGVLCEESLVLLSCNEEMESNTPAENHCLSGIQKTPSCQDELTLAESSSTDTCETYEVPPSPQENDQESSKTVPKESRSHQSKKPEIVNENLDLRDIFAQSKIQELLQENSSLKRKLKAAEYVGRKMKERALRFEEKSKKLLSVNKTLKKRLTVLDGQLKKSKREIKTPSGEIEVGVLYPV